MTPRLCGGSLRGGRFPALLMPREEEHEPAHRQRLPLYLHLQTLRLQDSTHDHVLAETAHSWMLQGQKKHFVTTALPVLQEVAKQVSASTTAESNFPRDASIMFCASLKGSATLLQLCEKLAAHTGVPLPETEPTNMLIQILKAVSSSQHLYLFLDCTECPRKDPHAILDTVLSLEAAARVKKVTLGIALAPEFLHSMLLTAMDTQASSICPGKEVHEGATLDITHPNLVDRSGFMVKRDGRLYGYLNWCPHVGTPLNMFPNKYWDFEKRFLLCATHGAVFHPEDGVCLGGPCAGKALRPLPLLLAPDGQVMLPSKRLQNVLNAFHYL
uniref:Rieske domain-containing protein n=1 Tax=Eutreptiella gymnastica TaxID=73025 RepID=A0A7S1J504_9EUGL